MEDDTRLREKPYYYYLTCTPTNLPIFFSYPQLSFFFSVLILAFLLLQTIKVRYDDDDDDDGPVPDPALEGGMPVPIRMAAEFPPELVATPVEDIDPYYADKKVRKK